MTENGALASLPITLDSPYLEIGDYPAEVWEETLLPHSPLRDDLVAILQASQGVGVLAREQALKESSDGMDQTARQTRNPLGLMARSDSEPYIVTGAGRKLRVFPTWADAFAEHRRRLTEPSEAYQSVGVRSLGQFIERYLVGWTPGGPQTFPPGESAESLRLYKDQLLSRINSRLDEFDRQQDDAAAADDAADVPAGFRPWDVPGLEGPLVLPNDITVRILLTPVGPHRPGGRFAKTGTTYHQTNNTSFSFGAVEHSEWQDGCTEGHPQGDVGVHAYVEDRLIMLKIPLNEECIATGDHRNQSHVSIEECVNTRRNPEVTENTTKWLHAAILAARGQNAVEHLFPHTSGSGCPHQIHAAGRWPVIEREVDLRIDTLNGGTPLPPLTGGFAEPMPIPKEWDGTDFRRPSDGHLFIALARVFAARVQTAARVTADPQGDKTRDDLQPGETFLAQYVTVGSDNAPWLISERGSRIRAADCTPSLTSFGELGAIMDAAPGAQEAMVIVDDPTHGLSADPVPADAPALSKEEFMAQATTP